ncbi:MAG: prepilin peptidase [Planctomycetota bacterium]
MITLFFIASAAIFGAIFGSYVNMASYRLPRDISTWKRSRSFCPKCQHQLAWFDNLPILSFLFLRGKCHYCRVPIPPRYLYAELICSALFALCAYQYFILNGGLYGKMPLAWFVLELFFVVDLLLLSIVDLEVWLIPIETTLWWIPPAFILAIIFPDDLHPSKTIWFATSPWLNAVIDSFSGAAIGAGFLWCVGFAVAALVFVRNKIRGIDEAPPEAMGMGDVHMLAMFGAMVGWKAALMAIMIGVMTGSVTGIGKILLGKLQRARMGKDWTPPPQPTFDLPEDGEPYEPMLWPLLVFGALVLFVTGMLNDRFNYIPGNATLDHLVPFGMMLGIGASLWIAFPFYLYLKKIGRMPGGAIVENDDGKKEEVYSGNYIPFGPSLAFGCLVVVMWDPLLRGIAYWFFAGTPGPAPTVKAFEYHTIGESGLVTFLAGLILQFNAASHGLLRLLGVEMRPK